MASDLSNIISQAQSFIRKGETEKAFDLVVSYLENDADQLSEYNELVLLQNQYAAVKKSVDLGIEASDSNLQKHTASFLELLSRLKIKSNPIAVDPVAALISQRRQEFLMAKDEHTLKALHHRIGIEKSRHPEAFGFVQLEEDIHKSLQYYQRTQVDGPPRQRQRRISRILLGALLIISFMTAIYKLVMLDFSSSNSIALITDSNGTVVVKTDRIKLDDASVALAAEINDLQQYRLALADNIGMSASQFQFNKELEGDNIAEQLSLVKAELLQSIDKLEKELIKKIEDTPILFELDSAELPAMADIAAQKICILSGRHPDLGVVVKGHTDDRGAESYNIGLSQKRAEVIQRFLALRCNIPEAHFTVEYFGESQPQFEIEDKKYLNRRVEIDIQ